MSSEGWALIHLRVAAGGDPRAMACIVERFRKLNILPGRFTVEWVTRDTLQIEMEIVCETEASAASIAAKLVKAPSVLSVYWHR